MAAISETAGSVFWGGTAGTAVELCSEWSISAEGDINTVPVFGQVWDESIPGQRRLTGTFNVSTDTTGPMQTLANAAFVNGSTAELVLGANVRTYIGTAFITAVAPTISATGKGDTVYSFRSTGTWTIA